LRPYDWAPSGARSATTDFSLAAAQRSEEISVAAAVGQFIDAAESGRVVNRSARPYMPSALRDLRGILEYHVVPELGVQRLRDIRRTDVQQLVDRLGAEHLSESRIRSVVSALRALYGYAIEQGQVEFNPADGLVMPRGDEPVRSRPDELWDDPPAWEDRPRRTRPPEVSDRAPREQAGDRAQREPRERPAYESISLLPERLLSFVLRAVFVLIALVALVTLLESL
jgi:hypothetical protein